MEFGIVGALLPMAVNIVCDIRNIMVNGEKRELSNNTIKLINVCSEDIPLDTRNQYCKSLEVHYGLQLKSLLESTTFNKWNSNPADIFNKIPLLNKYDKVVWDKSIKSLQNVSKTLLSNPKKTTTDITDAMDVFMESYRIAVEVSCSENDEYYGLENQDAIIKEARGAVPTSIQLKLKVSSLMGRGEELSFPISIKVIPKVVSNNELVQFFLKRKIEHLHVPSKDNAISKIGSLFRFNKKVIEKHSNIESETKKTLNEMMNSVGGINKPFVSLLVTDVIYDEVKSKGVDIKSKAYCKSLYDKLPILSISIYHKYTDQIDSSLDRDGIFHAQRLSDFNSQIAEYEKKLAQFIDYSNAQAR